MLWKAVGGFWLTAASDCTHRMLPFRQSVALIALISWAIFWMPAISHYPFWYPSDNAYTHWSVFQRRRMELLQLLTSPWEATKCVRTPLSFTCGRYLCCYSRCLKVETEVPLYVWGLYILFKLMIHQFPVHLLLWIWKSSDIPAMERCRRGKCIIWYQFSPLLVCCCVWGVLNWHEYLRDLEPQLFHCSPPSLLWSALHFKLASQLILNLLCMSGQLQFINESV